MSVNVSSVTRVYNGKIGCMCGCNGKYSTNPSFRELVGTQRGYPVGDSEISLRSVKIIAGKVLNNPNAIREGNYMYVEDKVANKMQVVYFE